MEIGLALPQYDYSVPGERPLRWETIERWADRAVALGFSSLWVSDHLFLSLERYGGSSERFGCFDAIVSLAALAQRYAQLTVGCLVFCAPMRAPRLLAKQLATLDASAPGRVVAGMGAGWYEPEFAEAGIAFGRPAARLRQLADAGREVRDFLGPDRVPLWFGGKGDRLVELAARHADGWNAVWAWRPDDYRAKRDVALRVLDAGARDTAGFAFTVGLTTLVGEDGADVERRWQRRLETAPAGVAGDFASWRATRLVGTIEQVREQADVWRSLGVRLLIVNLGALPFSVTDPDDLDLVASALIQE